MVFFGFLVIRSGLSQPLNKMVWLLRILCHDIPLLVFAAGAFMQQLIAFFGMLGDSQSVASSHGKYFDDHPGEYPRVTSRDTGDNGCGKNHWSRVPQAYCSFYKQRSYFHLFSFCFPPKE